MLRLAQVAMLLVLQSVCRGFASKVGAEERVLRIAVLEALAAVDCAIFVCVDVNMV